MKRISWLVLLVLMATNLRAQLFQPKNYPLGYFRNPLNIPISLAGNFGELRPNHFHMGLDIRTEKRVNLPVFAAADGYIARVKVEPAGFGQAIYINHPNGYTTLYAHLNQFFPALAAWVRQQQYIRESWSVFLDIPPGLFAVKKGDFIALSGSTGGSQAPHLHFEIRNTATDLNLNPLLFGLPVSDHTRPVLLKLAVYDRNRGIYEQVPRIYTLRHQGGRDLLPGGVILSRSSRVSFAISAFDTESGTSNRNGIYQAALYDNQKAVIGFQMDNIGYDFTRGVNAHFDYRTKTDGGPYFQQLFHLQGLGASVYHPPGSEGLIDLSDGKVHAMHLEVKDPFGNVSDLHFSIRFQAGAIPPTREEGKLFKPRMLDGMEAQDCCFYLGENCLYDSVHLVYTRSEENMPAVVSAVHHIGSPQIPLQDSFLVRIKPNRPLDVITRDKVVMKLASGSRQVVEKVTWQQDWASAKFRDFGSFRLVVDQEPPQIITVGFSDGANLSRASRIIILAKDNLGEVKHFRAELDGKWLCFSNDKGKSFIYDFDEHCLPGKHTLKISVEDEAGNQASHSVSFTR